MTITERIKNCMEEKNIRKSTIAKEIGVKDQIVRNWIERGTTPPMEYLPAICKTLGISWEYLITGQESGEPHYTHEEKRLIELYRSANDTGRTKISEYAADIARINPAEQENGIILKPFA